jgi:Na+/H+-dicarboxylate symporter
VKTLFKKENLFIRIAIGFGAGILLGTLAPGFSIDIKVLGDVYLNLIKMMVIPVLICAVMTGIINSSDMGSIRRVAVKTVLLYVVMFLASFAVAFGVAMVIRPGLGIVFENRGSQNFVQQSWYYAVEAEEEGQELRLTEKERNNGSQIQWYPLEEAIRLIDTQDVTLDSRKFVRLRDLAALEAFKKGMG